MSKKIRKNFEKKVEVNSNLYLIEHFRSIATVGSDSVRVLVILWLLTDSDLSSFLEAIVGSGSIRVLVVLWLP